MSMKSSSNRSFPRLNRVVDLLCIASVLIMPLFLGVFFFLFLSMEGTPVWYLLLHALLLLGSIAALVRFLSIGLFPRLKKKDAPGSGKVR